MVCVNEKVTFSQLRAINYMCARYICPTAAADAARPSASAASPAWGAIAGCPACALPDTDAGMTRLFRRGRGASPPPGAPVVEAPEEGLVAADRSSSALMTRDSLSRADVEALAGVLVAERARRLREDDDASSSSSSSADDDETDADPSGPTRWWPRRDVAAQLRSALGALPSLNALRTAAPGIFADLAVVLSHDTKLLSDKPSILSHIATVLTYFATVLAYFPTVLTDFTLIFSDEPFV